MEYETHVCDHYRNREGVYEFDTDEPRIEGKVYTFAKTEKFADDDWLKRKGA